MTRKRLFLIPLLAMAAATVAAATAFACTVFRGTFDVTGNAAGSGTVRVTGNDTGGMLLKSVSAPIAKASVNGGSVTVSTGVDPAKATNMLPARTDYQIRFYNSTAAAPGFSGHNTNWVTDCMAGPGGGGTQLGPNVTVANGMISGQPVMRSLPSSLRADTSPQESAVCISDPTGGSGNQAPLTIL